MLAIDSLHPFLPFLVHAHKLLLLFFSLFLMGSLSPVIALRPFLQDVFKRFYLNHVQLDVTVLLRDQLLLIHDFSEEFFSFFCRLLEALFHF